MTTSRPHRPGPAVAGSGPRAVRPARGTGLLCAALVGATSLATLTALPATASAPAPELSRVVVTAAGAGAGGVQAAAAAVAAAGGTVLDRLPLVGGVSAELPAGATLAPGLLVAPDRPLRVAQTDAPYGDGPASTVRETLGLGAPAGEGAGVTIAVVDTGVADHPDLAGRVTRVDVSGAGEGDGYGHGTFVAGVAAGSGAASNGRYAGVAPGAQVLDVRVADDDGGTDLITVLRGLEKARGADVVNLSLSSYSALPWQIDPLTVALTRLWLDGVVVVVPAGNDGPDAGSVTSPGVAPALLTVGALDEAGTAAHGDDVVAPFSGVGPAPQGVAKPELVAPGRSLVSLQADGSVIDVAHGASGAVGAHYFRGSGTSFASAAMAGGAAVLVAERALRPDEVKGLLATSAYPVAGAGAGAGGADLGLARQAPVPAELPKACRGGGRGASDCGAVVAGPPGQWTHLLKAMSDDDQAAAASSWSKLAPHVGDWVASSWSSLPAELRDELTAEWAARNWADAEQWAARNWAARNWAARNWAASSWSARNWAASSWSGEDWLYGWDARNWAARNWAARNWAARNWAASSWSARNWAARNWAAVEWGA